MTNPTDSRVEAATLALLETANYEISISAESLRAHLASEHYGDCTKASCPCMRCICEEAQKEAVFILKAADEAAWQPIETAPIEGKFILTDGVDVAEGSRSVLGSGFVRYDRAQAGDGYCVCYEEWEPSRWRPLPTPPEAP